MSTKDLTVSYLLDFYGDALTQKQKEVMQQYYNDDLSLAEIAVNFSITRQGVRDAIKRGEAVVRELEEKIGFAKRYSAVHSAMRSIEQLATSVKIKNETSYSMQPDISIAADEMLRIVAQVENDF